ncbi:hypothetical protein BRM1_10815 [Brevibacterium sp. BRM-1]|uniref:hypothetical protein n=1 Tax=Brevibacterium sp. BRM-1 TaxID=2999062 RepID=UPI00227F37BC|nr:hypothetical protein [Brevibacterium sp. BRM-1]WAL39739.1 hypothetical protein BRM1_10815 [Brevibacterium sp. BRM-1]
MRRRGTAVGAACAAALLLTGCGAIGVRTEDGAGGPLRLGLQETAGPPPPPTAPGDVVPDGYAPVHGDFGEYCPVRVDLVVPKAWVHNEMGGSGSRSFRKNPNKLSDAFVGVLCMPAFEDSAAKAIDSTARYKNDSPTNTITSQRKSAIDGGAAWAYAADLTKKDPQAYGVPTRLVSLRAAVFKGGKLYSVSIDARAPQTDTASKEMSKVIVEHSRIAGKSIAPPPQL